MSNNLRLPVFIFIWFFCLFLPNVRDVRAGGDSPFLDSEATISMDFQDANLKDILKIFSIQSSLNFIASEGVKDRKVTLYLDNVPVKEAMDELFKANNLSYELDSDSNIFIVTDLGKPGIEKITKVFYLKYATVSSSSLKEDMAAQIKSSCGTGGGSSDSSGGSKGKWKTEDDVGITQAVKKILSEYGSVIEDYRTNSLIVTEIPSRMSVIAQTIASLDVPIPQVMLEVEMLDVSKNTVDKLGFEFGNNPFTLILSKWNMGKMAFYIGAKNDKNREGGVTLGNSYAHLLDYLRTKTDTKYLARPRLLTLNNETAQINITTDEVIGEQVTYDDQGNVTARTAERATTGVCLRVTPQINLETGEITMFIFPSVKEAATSAFSSLYRDPEERGTKSLVKVKDGETVILGGLIRNDTYETITKLPILGDIPVLGVLFRHKNKSKDKERELLVFITPHIIKDAVSSLAKAALPQREQDTNATYDRRLTVSSSLDNFEKMMK